MDLATFAADRTNQLDSLDTAYRPAVRDALAAGTAAATIVALNEALTAMFAVLVEEQTGAPATARQTAAFIASMAPAVDKTVPDGTDEQEDRIVSWFSTATLGASSMVAAPGAGTKTWITMSDADVRDTHVVMHGITVDANDSFTVGTPPVRMAYPGQPVGDPENWINCRCVLSVDNDLGIAASLTAAISEAPWDGSASRFTDEEWCRSCIISLEEGCTSKSQHKLPIKEPSGTLSRAGVHAAAGRLNQTDAPPDKIASAKSKLRGAYDELGEEPPDSLTAAATDEATEEPGMVPPDEMEEDFTDDTDEPPPVDPPIIDGEELPWHGVLVAEGVPSGDQRIFREGSLTHRDLPLPLKWQRADLEEHGGSIIMGRIDVWERDENSWVWVAGETIDVPEADEVVGLIAQQALRGLSVDADQGLGQESDEFRQDLIEARACSATIVAIPAFHESFIRLGELSPDARDDSDTESPTTPTFARGPGWVTNPVETKRIHDYWTKPGHEGYAKIRWGTPGDFTRLRKHLRKYVNPAYLNRTAAQWHHDALGYWPGQKGLPGNPPKTSLEGDPMTASALNLVAAAPPTVVPAANYRNPQLTGPTALSVEGRHVFGHIARWGECHIGLGRCTEAPRSMSDYAYFHLGSVTTDEGELPVGRITLNTGHADLHASATDTMRHYDHTGTIVATVRAGEDDYGIWVAGTICDDVPDADVRTLKASGGISGDWRNIGGNLELVAALAVNVPGFPVPRTAIAASGGVETALVAAGIVAGTDIDALADAVLARVASRQEKAARVDRVKAAQREIRLGLLASVGSD